MMRLPPARSACVLKSVMAGKQIGDASPVDLKNSGKGLDEILVRDDDAPRYFSRGVRHYQKGMYTNAIEDFSRVIQIAPGDERAFNNRGGAYFAAGDMAKALEDYNAAIGLDDEYALAYANRGILFFYAGRHSLALNDMNMALSRGGADEIAYFNRGIVRYALGNIRGAADDFSSAVQINPKYSPAKVWRLALFAQSSDEEYSSLRAAMGKEARALPPGWNRCIDGIAHMGDAEFLR